MKREFFGTDLDAAINKAAERLGIPSDKLSYTQFEGIFGHSMQEDHVGILVEYDEADQGSSTPSATLEWNTEVDAVKGDPTEFGVQVLVRTLAGLGIQARVEAEESDDQVILKVTFEGEPPDTRRGEMRELRGSVQYLINRVCNEGRDGERRFIIDFGGDLSGRQEIMKALADDLAAKVKQVGQPLQIGLMDPQDRRLLHVALVDHPSVSTFSQGEGRFRVLCLKPKE